MTLIDKTSKPKTHVCMILDSSSSMNSIRQAAIDHFNEQVDGLRKKSKKHDIDVTLVTFNDDVVILRRQESVDSIKKLTLKEYAPHGMTALFDAIGYTVADVMEHCEDLKDENTAVLFLIITDGQENASKKYNVHQIKSMCAELEPQGWTFTFMAANVNPLDFAHNLGLSLDNVKGFVANTVGVAGASADMSVAHDGYFQSRTLGVRSVGNFYNQVEDKDKSEKSEEDVDTP